MASFSFDFLPQNDNTENLPSIEREKETLEATSSEKDNKKRPPFAWVEHVNDFMVDRAKEEIVFSEIPLEESSMTPIRCVDLSVSSFTIKKPDSETTEDAEPRWKETDLQPSVYEGGMKVWECSLDLVHYLAEQEPFIGADVLELGCGHGLPSSFLLREALRRQQAGGETETKGSFTLTDFNDFVIYDATISNLVLNTTSNVVHGEDSAFVSMTPVRLGFGDWLDMSRQLEADTFDLILAAETVYSDEAARDTATLLAKHLRPGTGVGLVATKRYYFGVGGGSDAFSQAAAAQFLRVETVRTYDSGTGNIRELLRVTRKGEEQR